MQVLNRDGEVLCEGEGSLKVLLERNKGNLEGAILEGVNLQGASLIGANLWEVDFWGASLIGADLRGANLWGASLIGANLEGVNLRGASLIGADLWGASLIGANLREANLREASLIRANFGEVNLQGANLGDAYLRGTNFRGANLRDTILDPSNTPNREGSHLFERRPKGRLLGYRTSKSTHVGSQEYKERGTYTVPWFSTSDTACHPGLYVWPTRELTEKWVKENDILGMEIIRVTFKEEDLHQAGDKWRVRSFTVLGG